ncbi:universal stress protein [Hymenobacter caeli]|uniref:Nucleotide-binding universal stress UspA family protein n=1 Tax=Hymenobacter caeli TaxID=2735894 RepID=A0ABX2FT44_9BACT|nr:universal stress protein [Hymenobacter caeli]NRT19565.1 nucleotide-binding universal stress UspA family protein [Hymenobacter caeli]
MALSLLVLTDFFQPADHALAYADALAGALGAQLVLLHVRRDSVLDPEHLTGRVDALGQEAIDLALASLARGLSAPVVAEKAHGRVAEAVADALRRHQPALVVLGHRNTDAMPDELVSTAALDILRAAPQPMLVVPARARLSAPHRLLLALDKEQFSLGTYAGLVRHLFDALPAELTVLHVGPDKASAETGTAAAREALERTGLALDLTTGLRAQSLVHATPAGGILQAVAGGGFDWVVLVARPHSFLGELFHRSVTAHVLLHSPVPVLVLPAV